MRSAAVAAGVLAMGYFRRNIKTWSKKNASPVTEADYLVDEYLSHTLMAERPDYGWLSEETTDDLTRLQKKRVFVVDPIDGTRGFIRGNDGWSISLAVVENGTAIAGVIYAPARDELYEAVAGKGAMMNSRPINPPKENGHVPIIPAAEAVYRQLRDCEIKFERGPYMPSLAHRMVQVATGKLDVAVARRGAQDWDLAAASIILGECGIGLEDVCSGPVKFNREKTRHGALAAMRDNSLRAGIREALIKVYGCPEKDHGKKAE